MEKIYARKLTKEELMIGGVTNITKDGKVFTKKGEVVMSKLTSNKEGNYYYGFSIYDSKDGMLIKEWKADSRVKTGKTLTYKQRMVGLHRAMWAWFYGEVPGGFVVDHIDNNHLDLEDYRLENFQLLTPKENLEKERGESTRELKCKLYMPLSYYEEKLAKYIALHEKAKEEHDAEEAHRQRCNISCINARIRYWKNHNGEEISKKAAEEKRLLEEKKQEKRDNVVERRKLRLKADEYKQSGDLKAWHDTINEIKYMESRV